MAERSRGMGRGLAAILSTVPVAAEPELRDLPVELIRPNPNQPRRTFGEEPLVALASSVKARGILQPVLVRPRPGGTYELIAGERRWRAAQLAGLESVPALIRPHDDAESLELALIENMAREELNPLEAARAVSVLVEELGLTREDIGRRVGRSRVAISNLLRLLELPDEALALIESGTLSEGHGRALLMAPDHAERRRLAREAAAHAWSVRHTEKRARSSAGRDEDAIKVARIEDVPHPDAMDAAERLGQAFGRVIGADVQVTPKAGGYRVQFAFASLEEALEAAERIGAPAPA